MGGGAAGQPPEARSPTGPWEDPGSQMAAHPPAWGRVGKQRGQVQGAGDFWEESDPAENTAPSALWWGEHSWGAAITPQLKPVSCNGVMQTWGGPILHI